MLYLRPFVFTSTVDIHVLAFGAILARSWLTLPMNSSNHSLCLYSMFVSRSDSYYQVVNVLCSFLGVNEHG